MFKLNRKIILGASATAAAAFIIAGCAESGEAAAPAGTTAVAAGKTCATSVASYNDQLTYLNGKKVIDGGVYYPMINDKRGPYYMNASAQKAGYSYGRTPTADELKAWDTTVTPWKLPPKGHGTPDEGSDIYDNKCSMCHGDFGSGGGGYPSLAKGNAYDELKSLKNQRTGPDMDGPIRVFGSYWPEASTLWWYIKEGMPHPNTRSLTDDQVYALTAYILQLNSIKIDGKELDDDTVLDQAMFAKIVMPNHDGFVPDISGPNGTDNVRAFFANPKNFGAQKIANPAARCMQNCQNPTAKVVPITIETKDFLPPLSEVRNLPKPKASQAGIDPVAKKNYESSCAVCHGAAGMGAPVLGNKADWAKYLKKGMKSVYANAISGINGMPPKGGTDLSDKKFKAVVDYMVSQSK